jgi:cytochrome c oxidase assembly protein subunit 15
MNDRDRLEPRSLKRFGSLATWATVITIELIVIGALVRATDSGLACPDWPLCYGQLIPQMNMQIFIEWFHRLMALILGVLLIFMFILLARNKALRSLHRNQVWIATGLFLNQCILGGLTVLKLLNPKIVTLHLINALFFLGLLIALAIKSKIYRLPSKKIVEIPSTKTTTFVIFAIAIVFTLAQIALGGLVATNHAGLVCPDFPTCFGSWFPSASYLVTLQMSHRYLGMALIFYLVIAPSLVRKDSLSPWALAAVTWSPVLALGQLVLGIINIYHALPLWATVGHQANAIIIISIYFAGFLELYEISVRQKHERLDQKVPSPVLILPTAIRKT